MTSPPTLEEKTIVYDDRIVRWFIWASIAFAIVGLLVGVVIALQLAFWQANLGVPYLTFSRLRPLHTNAAIFAFVGNMIFAGVYYSTQRLLKTRLASDTLSKLHFFGWQAIIVAAAVTLPLGLTTGKEYAELEWPIDIAIAVVWVIFAVNFFWTLARRNEKNLYVAIWFYIATIVTVPILHIVNNLEVPVSLTKSYSIFSGVQDALVQWWYGHNAVGFVLTVPILGIMYYFMPKAAERPVYSYRLSIVHFWALVFMYVWAGPHHLLYTALPDWAQTLGMVFSIALWAPSWGGMVNGILTLRGAWHKLRTDPVVKFLVAALTFYGMSTLEGPILSIKSVSALAHYTDWIVAHVHGGTLGWNGFMAAGMFYWLVPRLYGTTLHSTRAANAHFWIALTGIALYMFAMWISGVSQGLMWRAQTSDGALQYPNFLETLKSIVPLYHVRLVGGSLYFVGMVIMVWNLWATARKGRAVDGGAVVVVETHVPSSVSTLSLITRPTFLLVIAAVLVTLTLGWASPVQSAMAILALVAIAEFAFILARRARENAEPRWHAFLEGRPLFFTVLLLGAVMVGGVAELVPTIFVKRAVPAVAGASAEQRPYTPLEVEGRDIYIREGCYTCHSQMIRPLVAETQRYGAFSKPEEFIYDHPFQWGSKRTGPDLHRVGGKYPNVWHYTHLVDPRATSPGSNMPAYAWTKDWVVDVEGTRRKLEVLKSIGVPYAAEEIAGAKAAYREQAARVVTDLATQSVAVAWDKEIVALIAYLQRLGRHPVDVVPKKLSAGEEDDSYFSPFLLADTEVPRSGSGIEFETEIEFAIPSQTQTQTQTPALFIAGSADRTNEVR